MEKIEIYSLAIEALLRRYELATSMIRTKPCAETKAYRDRIVEKTMEVRRMMLAEHKRKLEEAEATAGAQQAQQPEVHRAQQHRYETVIEYNYGHTTRTDYPNKEVAVRAYNILKDLMGTIPVIERISLVEDDVTVRSYERNQ